MQVTGKIIAVLPYRQGVSNNGEWMSQDYVIEYADGNFNRKVCFTIFGKDRIEKANVTVGDMVTVYFDIDAHQYAGKWFTDIRAWKVERDAVQAQQPAQPQQQVQQPAQPDPFAPQPQEGVLPF